MSKPRPIDPAVLAAAVSAELTARARRIGALGGKARASRIAPERASAIARAGANARWAAYRASQVRNEVSSQKG